MIGYERKRRTSDSRVAVLLAAALIASMPVSGYATQELQYGSSADSTVEIEFKEGSAELGALDPDDPVYPGNGGTGESGSLALNFVSPFYFDETGISPARQYYPTTTQKPYIQVTDVRGTGAGWEVYARASNFEDAQGEISLKGSSIVFSDASLTTTTENVDWPTPASTFTLPANNSSLVKVVTANQSEGMGTWLVRWYRDTAPDPNPSVSLTVPGGSGMLGQHTAKITWYLTFGPIT